MNQLGAKYAAKLKAAGIPWFGQPPAMILRRYASCPLSRACASTHQLRMTSDPTDGLDVLW